ncbi:GNAT family N-acetyltransferase [Sediminicola sp. 1XM1-17]|uniref:GNAT family N-acetyltransferase n=1 Tax=Sediminicola sp. 1XM1-17 TaxID=3127702 RepID=UPI0030769D20
MEIRTMIAADWEQVAAIYAEGMATGFATFETKVPTYAHWDGNHLVQCRLVALQDHQIVGWAALSPVSGRCVYGGVAEVSVYVGAKSRGLGVGKLLLQRLIQESEKEGYWTLQSGIFPENKGSILLHEKMGFRRIGHRERVAQLHGIWKDNVLFERRSTTVGI